jgi:hypothetical protein
VTSRLGTVKSLTFFYSVTFTGVQCFPWCPPVKDCSRAKRILALLSSEIHLQPYKTGFLSGPAFDLMLDKLNRFRARAQLWIRRRDQLAAASPDPLEQRALNDQLMMLERVFLLEEGLPGRPDVRHAFFSPAKFDLYGTFLSYRYGWR